MKKIISAISVVMLLIASAASCQKEVPCEEQSVNVSMQYSFDISVNGGPGFDDTPTKAVKTGWENGDKIFLFFKPTGGSLLTDTYATMTYNGTSWATTMHKDADLKSGGKLSAVYVPYITNSIAPTYSDSKWNITCGDVYYNCAESREYKVESGTVKATLAMKIPADYVQFYITGIANTEILTCNNVDSYSDITIDGSLAVASKTKTTDGKMTGRKFSTSDQGIVFFGRLKSTLPTDCHVLVTKAEGTYRRVIVGKKLEHKAYNLGAFSTTNWTPVLLPGEFSVSATKSVRFSYGNLYWTGSAFEFEKDQFSYPTSWDSNHVGHFYWTIDAASAYAVEYVEGGEQSTDVLFTNKEGFTIYGQTGWRTLSKDEWDYLLNTRDNATNKRNIVIVIDGENVEIGKGLVIAPDSFSGPLQSPYKIADLNEKGLVFLPLTGSRQKNSVSAAGVTGYYWTGTAINGNGAKCMYFNNSVFIESNPRSDAKAIRLVKDAK